MSVHGRILHEMLPELLTRAGYFQRQRNSSPHWMRIASADDDNDWCSLQRLRLSPLWRDR
jgi:hypothetical protein